jgi:putative ABC transport system ATP-binding protein
VGRGPSSRSGQLSSEPEPSGTALSLTGVRYLGHRSDAPAAAGASLQVPPGQTVALFSRPAAEAASLLDVIAGLHRPGSGEVLVDGIAVHRLRGAALDRYRRHRGLLSTRFPLLPSMSVVSNVLAAAPSRRVDVNTRDRAAELLELTGTRHLAAKLAGALSAEQQWRVLIARALLASARLVLAEDPSPGLELGSATVILDLLIDIQARFGFTLLLATASLATASRCERLVRLAGGHVAADDLTGGDDEWTRGRIDRIG